jgi:putative glutathione S-transferase
VYKAGFAKSQEAYRDAVVPLFEALDRIEARLKDKTYLVGDRLTEADVRLFVTIVSSRSPNTSGRCMLICWGCQIRFDPVYVSHFKCNIRTIRHGYPNIHLQVFFFRSPHRHLPASDHPYSLLFLQLDA